jgi:hypothetical protein
MKPQYTPTPNLRERVFKCIDKVLAEGYKLVDGTYLSDGACCVLGAISVCQDAPEDSHDNERQRKRCFALSLEYLNCHPIELDSIEAGFEGWSFEIADDDENEISAQTIGVGDFDDPAYEIGRDIFRLHVSGVGYDE